MAEPKVVLQNEIDDLPLPESVSWDTLTEKPTSLAEISITDATTLDTAASAAAAATAGLTDLAIQGWGFAGVFSPNGQTQVDWTAGALTFKDGSSYSIASGSVTGLSTSVPTYIYFSKTASTTVLQTTTTAANAVGANKVLVAVCQGNSASGKNAIVQAFGSVGNSPYVGTANIAASSITSALIAAGTIVASNIAANTITGNEIAANTITSNKISVSQLSAISADMGSITAGTITGALIRTASSGARVQLNNSTLALEIYDSSRLRATSWSQGFTFYDSSGNNVADIYAGSTGGLLITTGNSGSSSRSIYIQAGSSGVASLGIGGTSYIYANGSDATVSLAKDLQPTVSTVNIGGNPYNIGSIKTTFLYMNTVGYVNSGGSAGTPYPAASFSISKPGTGRYTITHPFGSSNYVVMAIALRASGSGAYATKIEARGSSSFTVSIFDDTGTSRDSDFMFLLMPIS